MMLSVFPSYMLNDIQNLETLVATDFDALGVVFEAQANSYQLILKL